MQGRERVLPRYHPGSHPSGAGTRSGTAWGAYARALVTEGETGAPTEGLRAPFGLRLRRDFQPAVATRLPPSRARCGRVTDLLVSINAFLLV